MCMVLARDLAQPPLVEQQLAQLQTEPSWHLQLQKSTALGEHEHHVRVPQREGR